MSNLRVMNKQIGKHDKKGVVCFMLYPSRQLPSPTNSPAALHARTDDPAVRTPPQDSSPAQKPQAGITAHQSAMPFSLVPPTIQRRNCSTSLSLSLSFVHTWTKDEHDVELSLWYRKSSKHKLPVMKTVRAYCDPSERVFSVSLFFSFFFFYPFLNACFLPWQHAWRMPLSRLAPSEDDRIFVGVYVCVHHVISCTSGRNECLVLHARRHRIFVVASLNRVSTRT